MQVCKNNPAQDIWHIAEDGAARWIFPEQPPEAVNQYVDFLQVFTCDALIPEPELLISADTDFVVWLNGQLIGHGQYSNYPDRKTYERLPLSKALREGRNTLVITVFYNGRNSSVYRRGEPGLIFEVHGDGLLAASGTYTLCRRNPCYHSGPVAVVSGQLSYTFGYDAQGDDGFYRDDYAAGKEWAAITEAETRLPEERTVLTPRPVARLVDSGSTQAKLIQAGSFRFDVALAESEFGARALRQMPAGLMLDREDDDLPFVSPAWQMQHAKLEATSTTALAGVPEGGLLDERQDGLQITATEPDQHDGIYLLFDLGREEVGYPELEIEAPAGTLVDAGYGEHLDDGRVRTFVGRRNFAGRYVCRQGRQRFTHPFLRWAGRYLQLHVHARTFKLYHIGLRRREYPVASRGALTTDKDQHASLLNVGCRTLQLCMHEHYEDTPWREQALYANDARTQALCGYYAFGETAMPAASFTLLGQGLRDDGFLNLTAPAKPPITIPSFTFAWMLAVRDHYLYSGDDRLARAFLPQLCSMLRSFLDERHNGLLPLRRAKGIWHFYDWSAGMSGYSDDDFAQGLEADAPLNCFLILALEAALQMLDWCGESGVEDLAAAAVALRQSVAAHFWDPEADAFRTHGQTHALTELTQALAVLAKVGDENMRERALLRMARADSGLAEPGLSQSFYTFEALLTRKARFGAKVMASIEETWGHMLAAGATTFWETIRGARDFNGAGSLCHGWSAVPVYVLYHDLLGVRPLQPGFRTFAVEPMSQAVACCSGRVPVPGGEIKVYWEPADGEDNPRCEVTAPDGLQLCRNQADLWC